MKGKTLEQLAREITHIRDSAVDYKVSPHNIEMTDNGNLQVGKKKIEKIITPTNWAHQQIASFTEVPKSYYDKMLADGNTALLAQNVNHWLGKSSPEDRRMLRTVDGKLRGFLSPRYRRLDSYDLLNTVVPILKNNNFEIVSCELTDMRLYLKATLPKLQKAVAKDDIIQSGIILSTSDVGAGSLRVEPYILRLLCTNGLIGETAIKKYHVGREVGGDALLEILSDEALAADDESMWLKVRDVLLDSIRPETFEKQCNKIMSAVEDKIENYDLVEVVKRATTKLGFTSKERREDIVRLLGTGNEGSGLTRWGLVNSFTAAAKALKVGYDESVELERAGGQILNLSRNEWRTIAVE